MSTLVILRAALDGRKLEEMAQGDPNPFAQLAEQVGQPQGLIRHRTFATEDEVVVVDEWESPEDFQRFIQQPEMQRTLADVGASQPQMLFARKLELGDDFG